MYFPTAGIACNPVLPFFVSLGISFFTSMGGITGALLLLPFQMSVLGYVNPSVSATNQFFNVLACPSGVWAYWREDRTAIHIEASPIADKISMMILTPIANAMLDFTIFIVLRAH